MDENLKFPQVKLPYWQNDQPLMKITPPKLPKRSVTNQYWLSMSSSTLSSLIRQFRSAKCNCHVQSICCKSNEWILFLLNSHLTVYLDGNSKCISMKVLSRKKTLNKFKGNRNYFKSTKEEAMLKMIKREN